VKTEVEVSIFLGSLSNEDLETNFEAMTLIVLNVLFGKMFLMNNCRLIGLCIQLSPCDFVLDKLVVIS